MNDGNITEWLVINQVELNLKQQGFQIDGQYYNNNIYYVMNNVLHNTSPQPTTSTQIRMCIRNCLKARANRLVLFHTLRSPYMM